jgi:hypothetical protein
MAPQRGQIWALGRAAINFTPQGTLDAGLIGAPVELVLSCNSQNFTLQTLSDKIESSSPVKVRIRSFQRCKINLQFGFLVLIANL